MHTSHRKSSKSKHNKKASCHSPGQVNVQGMPLVAIVGNPNVGKSVLFNILTGAYVTVSNYPGTTVEVSRGKGKIYGREVAVVDTPGMYSLLPITEEEKVARDILLYEQPDVILHVVDAKNLERMLPMVLQLIEAKLPVVLIVNFMDEAERLGIEIDLKMLEQKLGIPVVATSFIMNRGIASLKEKIGTCLNGASEMQSGQPNEINVPYHPVIKKNVQRIEAELTGTYHLNPRAISLLLLNNDKEIEKLVRANENGNIDKIFQIVEDARKYFSQPLSYLLMQQRVAFVRNLLATVVTTSKKSTRHFANRLNALMLHPMTGIPFLLISLYLLYQFVGVFGAQVLVDFLENTVFGQYINPPVNQFLDSVVPWQVVRDLFGGEYGIITLGIRYAVAIILPIVGTFFLAFSVFEDSGYLPRLAMLIDRVFKKIGLNGRAVIPMVLGFGCDTMATIVTRTLETRRERLLSTLLLALAIPCSAQLGVILGLFAGRTDLLLLWAGVVTGIFLLVGFLAARVMPGQGPAFYMELPPLRLPKLSNVLVKTYTRMEWYFWEVFPLFILASVLIWAGKITGLFDLTIRALVPLVRFLGLPDDTAVAFLFGFFRRDYGAAGLYDIQNILSGRQLVVAAITLTLFVPCIAQFSVMIKERGWKTALAVNAFIFPFAFLVGALLNWLFILMGIGV